MLSTLSRHSLILENLYLKNISISQRLPFFYQIESVEDTPEIQTTAKLINITVDGFYEKGDEDLVRIALFMRLSGFSNYFIDNLTVNDMQLSSKKFFFYYNFFFRPRFYRFFSTT